MNGHYGGGKVVVAKSAKRYTGKKNARLGIVGRMGTQKKFANSSCLNSQGIHKLRYRFLEHHPFASVSIS